MWGFYALLSALFAGATSILVKCGIEKTDSNVASAIRNIVVLLFAWIMVFVVGSQSTISTLTPKTWVFLILSGLATGGSWLCYFRALQLGDINKVVPIDKSSTVMTILLALIFLGEGITWVKGLSTLLIGYGTWLMIQKKETAAEEKKENKAWMLYAFGAAIFASLTAILGKIGIHGIDSNLGTAIRTCVVLLMSWIIVFVTRKQKEVTSVSKKELLFICLSGLATGSSWLCYYRALQDGPASVVVPIDKLSIVVTIGFSWLIFKEKLSKKAMLGLLFIVAGTLGMLIK